MRYKLCLMVSLVLPVAFCQQITGLITGSVRDASGGAVASAAVKLVSAGTGAERLLKTDETGDFVISSVDPGEYLLTVQAPGFRTFERKGIILTASERLSVGTLSLHLGTVNEQVTVTAQGADVQTVSGERSATIDSSQVEELLSFGRITSSLVALVPGVVDPTTSSANRTIDGTNLTDFNVLGNRTSQNNFTVDGVTMTAPGGSPNGTFGISQESVSEVKVLLSNYQAEYGRLAGCNVQIITKSGARDFHANGMFYKRHEELNANNFFNNRVGMPRPLNRLDEWTYNVGGPVYIPGKFNRHRDKLFFFWNHEYLPRKTSSGLSLATSPTAAERTGNFSQSVDVNGKLITVKDPLTGKAFPGNIVPAERLDANGLALLSVFPLPNFLDRSISQGNYNYVTQWNGSNNLQMLTLKLDYNIGSKDALSISFLPGFANNTSPNIGGVTSTFPIFVATMHTEMGTASTYYRHIFSPTIVHELRVGYAYIFAPPEWTADGIKPLIRSTYGFDAGSLAPANNPLGLLPGMAFGTVTNGEKVTYDGRFPFNQTRNTWDVSDSVSMKFGAHMLKAGVFIERMRQRDGPWDSYPFGSFGFGSSANNPYDSGYAYSNAALGVFYTYTESTARPLSKIYSTGVDWFVQDNWRATRKLTLDYGIRFNWFEPFYNYNHTMAGFVPSLFDPNQQVQLIRPAMVNGTRVGQSPVTGAVYSSALIGFIAPGAGNPSDGMVVTPAPGYSTLVNNSGALPAPRFGFAYDPFGDGKTAIRGGFGIFANRILGVDYTANYSYPIVQDPIVYYGTLSTFTSAQGNLSPASVVGWDRNAKTSTAMNMSFTIQRDIGFRTIVDVGYVGSLGRHLPWQRSLENVPLLARFNPANADPTNPKVSLPDAFLRPILNYSGIGYNENAGTSNYHSLQVTANRRFTRDVQFGAAWTWSKAMDFVDDNYGVVNTLAPFRPWNYGMAGFDRTHVVKLNWLWDVPKFRGSFAPARAVLQGWQLSGIATFQSGAPVAVSYSTLTNADLSGTPSITPRIVVTGDPILPRGDRTFNRNFNTNVFAPPALGTLGDMSKTLLRGPGIDNWDMALFRNFSIRERFRMQLRSEFYNTFNHTQFLTWNTAARFDANGNQVNGLFGQDNSARDPRMIQLALRLQF